MTVEQLRQRDGDQPLPKSGVEDVGPAVIRDLPSYTSTYGRPVVNSVQADFEERIRIGIERYRKPLQTWNGRDALLDTYQELLDAAHYSKQDYLEHYEEGTKQRYETILMLVFLTKAAMLEREKSA